MNLARRTRSVALVALLAAFGAAAHAQGDIYSRLMDMQAMDADKDSMISKDEFLAMIGKLWDMKASDMKARDGRLNAGQLKELEKLLGRELGARAAQ